LGLAAVVDLLGAAPEAALFVDDGAKKVVGAEQASLGGHVYVDVGTRSPRPSGGRGCCGKSDRPLAG
jgi:FMN phosphatase YigB (HAD superfamily)